MTLPEMSVAASDPAWSSTPGSKPSPREIGIMRGGVTDGSTKFVGSASGIHFARTVYNAFLEGSARARRPSAIREVDVVPGEDDQLPRTPPNEKKYLWRAEEVDYENGNRAVSFDDLIRWTRGFFENWHTLFPFLHAPSVLHALSCVEEGGINSVSQTDALIARSIISISLADNRQLSSPSVDRIPAGLLLLSIDDALSGLQVLFRKPDSIDLLQAAVCVQLFLISMLRFNTASRIGGFIIRTAYHLGLHRCPSRFSCFDSRERTKRRRIFWSLYCLERHLSHSLGLPLNIRDDDIDVCFPDDERHTQDKPGNPADTEDEEADPRLRMQNYLARHSKIKGLILELRNKAILHSQSTVQDATLVNIELARWWNQVSSPPNCAVTCDTMDEIEDEPYQDDYIEAQHRLLLSILRHESIIALNRPLLAADKTSSEYASGLQTCITSSRSIILSLKRYVDLESGPADSSSDDVPGSTAGPPVWPSFTWAIWMSSFILLYAALEKQLPTGAAIRHTDISLRVLHNLSSRGTIWPTACAQAVRDLKSALFALQQKPTVPSKRAPETPMERNRGQSRTPYGQPSFTTPRMRGDPMGETSLGDGYSLPPESGSTADTSQKHTWQSTGIGIGISGGGQTQNQYMPDDSATINHNPSDSRDIYSTIQPVQYPYIGNQTPYSGSAIHQGPMEGDQFAAENDFMADNPFNMIDLPWLLSEGGLSQFEFPNG